MLDQYLRPLLMDDASRPAISTVPATRNPSSIGVMPKARVLLLIGGAGTTSGLNSIAW